MNFFHFPSAGVPRAPTVQGRRPSSRNPRTRRDGVSSKEVLWRRPSVSRRFCGGALPYSNNRNRWQDLTLESSAKNTAKYVVSWIRLDILVNLSADSRVKFLQLICRKGASIVLQGFFSLGFTKKFLLFNYSAKTFTRSCKIISVSNQ